MIQTELLQLHIQHYRERCRRFGLKPSYSGLASELGCCTMTILNVVRGTYSQGKPYTTTPSATRIIHNDDFELLQALFRVSGKKIDNTKKNAPDFAQKYAKKRLNYDGVVREGIEPVNNTDLKNEGDKYDEIGTV